MPRAGTLISANPIGSKRRAIRNAGFTAVFSAGTLTAFSHAAQSQTLGEALAEAYRSNPTLAAARANQRAIDEGVPLAKADGRPLSTAGATYSEQLVGTAQPAQATAASVQTTPARSFVGQASVLVPLYNGGSVRNAVKAAEARVKAGQDDLRGTEASVFSRVVAAYMDVIRDSEIVRLNGQNVATLEFGLKSTSDRYEAGDLTRTDVAQSQARLDAARADLERARAQLVSTKENYVALVGSPPEELTLPPPLPGLPVTPELAVETALADNSDIAAAQMARAAARYDVRSAKGAVMPRVSAFANGSYTDFLGSEDPRFVPETTHSAAAGLSITVPLYQGGRPAAAQRQATAREAAAIEQAIAVERDVIAQVRASYASWWSTEDAMSSVQSAIRAAELSLQGVEAENSVGNRTILDVLNARQELLNSRVQLVVTRRDAYVAAFSVLAAMGRADARELGLDVSTLDDPAANYARVGGKLLDFSFDPNPTATASRTIALPAQDATPIAVRGGQ